MSGIAAARQDEQGALIDRLRQQRTDLVGYVRRTRQAFENLAPSALRGERIDKAKTQMQAVVEATESAADLIMTRAEDCLNAPPSETAEAYRERVTNACLAIIEACAFQDLTGQRIKKVMTLLGAIDTRLAALEAELGEPFGSEQDDVELGLIRDALLQGPALPNGGLSQKDADALLKRPGG